MEVPSVCLLSFLEPTPVITLEVDSAVMCMDFCPRAPRYVAIGTESGEIDLFDLMAVSVSEEGDD